MVKNTAAEQIHIFYDQNIEINENWNQETGIFYIRFIERFQYDRWIFNTGYNQKVNVFLVT